MQILEAVADQDKIKILACVWLHDPNGLGWVEHVFRLFALESRV